MRVRYFWSEVIAIDTVADTGDADGRIDCGLDDHGVLRGRHETLLLVGKVEFLPKDYNARSTWRHPANSDSGQGAIVSLIHAST
jgi:hypothetical protein